MAKKQPEQKRKASSDYSKPLQPDVISIPTSSRERNLFKRSLTSVRDDVWRVPENILVFLFIFLLPTQFGKHFFFPFSYLSGVRVDYLAPTVFVTDILAVFLIVLNAPAVFKLFKNKWLATFLLLLAVSGFFAQSGEIFLYRFVKILELLGVFAVFRYRKFSLKLLLNAFLLGGVLQFVLVLTQFINKQSLQGIFYFLGERYLNLSMPGIAKATLQGVEFLRPYGTFSHPNSLAGFYLLVYFFFSKQKLSPWSKNTLLVLSFLIVLLSFSKTALVVFFILQLYLLKDEFKKITCLPCLVSKVLLFSVPLIIFAQATTDPLSLQKRYLLMQNALTLISQNWAFGVGLGNYLIAQTKLPTSLVSFPYQPVHNIFLFFIAETGILTSLLAIYFGVKKFLSNRKNVIFVSCCLVVILTGLLDHYWLTLQQNWLLAGVITGALAAGLGKTE